MALIGDTQSFLPSQRGSSIAPQTGGGNTRGTFLQPGSAGLIPTRMPAPTRPTPTPLPTDQNFNPGATPFTGTIPTEFVPGKTGKLGPGKTLPPTDGSGPAQPNFGDLLGGQVQNFLQNPSRFDLQAVMDAFNFLKGDLEQQAAAGAGNIRADAARRGAFFSTVPNQSLFQNEERLQRGLGDLATNLLLAQATTQGQDRQASIGAGLDLARFGEAADQNRAQMALQALLAGQQGGPSIPGSINPLFNVATPQGGGVNQGLFGLLGQLLAAQGQQPAGG